jgi:hypothetical protein
MVIISSVKQIHLHILIEQYWKVVSAEELTDKEVEKKLSEYIDNLKELMEDDPELKSKILQFPSKDKLH